MTKIPYSDRFFPPAPVIEVALAYPDQSPLINREFAMIDTGADCSFVPTWMLQQMRSKVVRTGKVRSHLGDQSFVAAIHSVDIVVSSTIRLPSIEVISNDWDDFIILGRNFLNKLTILLDGIKQTTRVTA